MMFGKAIDKVGAPAYGPPAHVHRLGRLMKAIGYGVSAYGSILVAEEILDRWQRELMKDERVQPLVRMVCRIHVLEEARHMTFARDELEQMVPRLSRVTRTWHQAASPRRRSWWRGRWSTRRCTSPSGSTRARRGGRRSANPHYQADGGLDGREGDPLPRRARADPAPPAAALEEVPAAALAGMIAGWRRTSAFLRAINLGATRKFPKADIVAAVEAAGFTDVETYINTGNVRFDTTMRSRAKIEAALEKAFLGEAGFEVPTISSRRRSCVEIAEHADVLRPRRQALRLAAEGGAVRGRRSRRLEEVSTADEVAKVGGRAVHLLLGDNYHEAKLTNAVVEKQLGVATNRNLTVIRALAEKWC